MPIKYVDRIIESATLSSDLELEAKSGEGFIIKDIFAESSGEGEFLTMIISDTMMFNALVEKHALGMLPFPSSNKNIKGFFSNIREKYPEVPLFRVSEGEKLILTKYSTATKVLVRYAHLTGADIPKSTESGGTLSDNRLLVSNGSKSGTTSTTSTEYVRDFSSMNAKGFIDFPFLEKVPAGYRMELLGFCLGKETTSSDVDITGIRLWLRDESILKPNQSYCGVDLFKYLCIELQEIPFLFDAPIPLVVGDKLESEVSILNEYEAQAYTIYLTFIFNQIKV